MADSSSWVLACSRRSEPRVPGSIPREPVSRQVVVGNEWNVGGYYDRPAESHGMGSPSAGNFTESEEVLLQANYIYSNFELVSCTDMDF